MLTQRAHLHYPALRESSETLRKRTSGREFALKALYLRDVRGELTEDRLSALAETQDMMEIPEFGRHLIDGVLEAREELDELIQATAENWRLDRMPTVDRNVLRIGVYELLHQDDTPPRVAINEAIEMAKKFSTENSPMFVNGVLDKIYSTSAATDEREGEPTEIEQPRSFPPLPLADIAPDPMQKVDLHTHSDCSDGSLEPAELIRRAARKGLAAVALTDHDSVSGIREARAECEMHDLKLVPGVELTAYSHGDSGSEEYELHLLGYFVDETDPYLLERLDHFKEVREDRIEKIAARLRELGVELDPSTILDHASDGSPGRVHVAQELVRQGTVKDVREAFDRFLDEGGPAYVPKERLTPAEAVRLIHEVGGAAVLAHPGATDDLRESVNELEEAGLDGIEVHYPSHSPEQEAWWLDTARKLDLVVTGGSDFHGDPKPHIHVGQETVPMAAVVDLRARARRYREGTPMPVGEDQS
ncbi:MAG: transcription antitermination factor NusB [Candidatus Brocadiia bacterium]